MLTVFTSDIQQYLCGLLLIGALIPSNIASIATTAVVAGVLSTRRGVEVEKNLSVIVPSHVHQPIKLRLC